MKVRDILNDFKLLVGDDADSLSTPDSFLITGLNKCLRELPLNPKLDKIFSHHFKLNLDAKEHWRWNLTNSKDEGADLPFFDTILDFEYLHFWTSTGGDPCRLKLCNVKPRDLYANALPELTKAGKPCKYAIEREGDNMYLVLDRRSDVPIILDFIAYGIPRNVNDLEDEVPISRLCENAVLDILRTVWYEEADDLAFANSVFSYLDNKYIPQLVQEINKRLECEAPAILGN